MGDVPARVGAKLGPRIAMLVSQAMVHTHAKLIHVKHKLAMMVFHAISDEISEEVDVTLGPFLKMMHDSLPDDHPAKPSVKFMHEASGQLKALAGTGLQISGLFGALATVMNNYLADTVYGIVHSNPHLLPDAGIIMQAAAAHLIDPQEAYDAVMSLGIPQGWAEDMYILSQQWPDMQTGLELMRRGEATQDQFAQWMGYNGMQESIVAKLLSLKNIPLSPADAALAVIRGNITADQAQAIATENGVTPENFAILTGNTGEPPGLQELLEAYRRGFIDKATLERGILQSRYRNEWIPMLEQLRYSPISIADAVNAVVQNQMDNATAAKVADENGLEPGSLDVLIATAGEPLSREEMEQLYNRGLASKDQVIQALRESRLKNKYNDMAFDLHAKILPFSEVSMAIRNGGMTQDQGIAVIMANGFDKASATAIVQAATGTRLQSYRTEVVNAVQALYADNLISPQTATSTTEGMGFTADEAKLITQASEFKREAKLLQQSVSAIRAKYLQHHITSAQASGFLDKVGLPAAQRDQLLTTWEIELGTVTRELTAAQILKAYKLELITEDDCMARLEAMGYSEGDATLLVNGA